MVLLQRQLIHVTSMTKSILKIFQLSLAQFLEQNYFSFKVVKMDNAIHSPLDTFIRKGSGYF